MSYLFCFYHTVIISQNQYIKTDRNHSFRLSNTFFPFLKWLSLYSSKYAVNLTAFFSVAYSSNSLILLFLITPIVSNICSSSISSVSMQSFTAFLQSVQYKNGTFLYARPLNQRDNAVCSGQLWSCDTFPWFSEIIHQQHWNWR